MDDAQVRLIEKVNDERLVDYFYLKKNVNDLVDYLENLSFKKCAGCYDIPFNASVKGYLGAADHNDEPWIVKPILSEAEALYHRITELVYLLDFQMATLSAPTVVLNIDGKKYRGSKVVPNAIQISSYDYMKNPFKKILISDLVNRWLHFDEDRNPNNYMVIQNSQNTPLIVAIDFDKSDLENETMKIVGTDDKFGWIRHEKNRYLTLFKPENFEKVPISHFETRLQTMMAIDLGNLEKIATRLLTGYCPDPASKARLVAQNIRMRREYVNNYFRRWFKEIDEEEAKKETETYAGFGQSFLKMYQDKK